MGHSGVARDLAPEVRITDAEFERFRDYFYRKTGIRFEDSKRYFVDKRLIQRMCQTGHESFREYFAFMRFQASGKEFQDLVNLMTVNETYFFREEYQLKCMVNALLGEVLHHKRSGETVRIWSVPCSTGEEPYSIALYLLEFWDRIDEVDVEIVASDIDTQALEKARAGVFSRRSVSHLPHWILKKYFEPLAGGYHRLCEDLRACVDFRRVNLCHPKDTRGMRDFDVIFCRNLLIYFDEVSQRRAAQTLYDALNPGGFVLLGHSESMSRITSLFKVRRFKDAIVYQKPL